MPDWHELVKQRLRGIRLTEQETAEVTEELAEHLQSVYQTSLSEGRHGTGSGRKGIT